MSTQEATQPQPVFPQTVEKSFFFRADKDGNKRDTVTVDVPQIDMDTLLASLDDDNDPRVQRYAIDLVNEALVSAARKQIDTADSLIFSELTLEKLACAPKAMRGNGIDTEALTAFATDYIETHVALGKAPEKAEKAASIFVKKLTPVKNNKAILEIMATLLADWFTHSENASDHMRVYEYLTERLEALQTAEPTDLADFL